ncbi:unnamed protein product, partial [marine sediment metagenome]
HTSLKIIYVWFTENHRNLQFRMKAPKGQSEKTWKIVINNMRENFEKPVKSEQYDKLIKVSEV